MAFAALAIGVIKKNGIPKFNKEYLQKIMLDDNFQMVFYLLSVSVSMTPNFIIYSPLVLTAVIEGADSAKVLLERNPRFPFVSMFKENINKAVQFKAQFYELRSDIEIYVGIYTIVGIFFGFTSFMSIIIYWQLMRIRYLMSYNMQGAFRRLDLKIQGYTNNPSFPALLRIVYHKIREVMLSMGDMG